MPRSAPPRVALVVDNPLRDLPGVVLTATSLCRAGVTCFLVPFNLWWRELWQLAPDLVVPNYLRPTNQETVRQAIEAGIGVAVLDTEGAVIADLGVYRSRAAPDRAVHAGIQRFLSWGPAVADTMVEHGFYRPEQVVVTGCSRFDLYRAPWREASQRRSQGNDRFGRPLVLINGVFSRGNPRFASVAEEAQSMVEREGYSLEGARAYQATQLEMLEGLVALTNQLAQRFPHVSFVYRPHPFEDPAFYDGRFTGGENVRLVQEGTVDGWILRASAVIQRSCSTAIESGMAGVPSLSPAWLPEAEQFPMIQAVEVPCVSAEELGDRLERALAGDDVVPAETKAGFADVIATWFHQNDGQNHVRVGQALLDCLGEERAAPRRVLAACRRRAHDLTNPELSTDNRLKARVRAGLRLPTAPPPWDPVLAWAQQKRFYAEDVRAWVELFALCDPSAPRLGVATAEEAKEYRFGDVAGRSVVVRPVS